MEKQMITDKDGVGLFGRFLRNVVSGVGMKRIEYLQQMPDYFKDLCEEYKFYVDLDNAKVKKGKDKVRYKLVSSYSEITDWRNDEIPTIFIILSIEGCHVFNTGLQLAGQPKADWEEVEKNINIVKGWDYPPVFVSLAHHFDTELCGFEQTFEGVANLFIKQKVDPEQGITYLGENVIKSLLDNSNGKRILIDVKHMNVKSRYQYYQLLKKEYEDKDKVVPIVVSHGAVNGMNYPTLSDEFDGIYSKGGENQMDKNFYKKTINFYDDEIYRIAKSKGIFGIQLDERRIANKKVRGLLVGRDKSSLCIWKQIEHIAKCLDIQGLDAWGIQCLGTDFDGIIDPLPGFWKAKDLDYLPKFLLKHANEFLLSERGKKLKTKNKIPAEKIIDLFMRENASGFLKENFKKI